MSGRRPLWLFVEPRPLQVRAGQPRFSGVLSLQEGPERIESGWWDGNDVTRDYYVAENLEGERLWVFHDLQEGGQWFLHGVFG